jgi:hypothetical protein
MLFCEREKAKKEMLRLEMAKDGRRLLDYA